MGNRERESVSHNALQDLTTIYSNLMEYYYHPYPTSKSAAVLNSEILAASCRSQLHYPTDCIPDDLTHTQTTKVSLSIIWGHYKTQKHSKCYYLRSGNALRNTEYVVIGLPLFFWNSPLVTAFLRSPFDYGSQRTKPYNNITTKAFQWICYRHHVGSRKFRAHFLRCSCVIHQLI